MPDGGPDKRQHPRFPWVLRVEYPDRRQAMDATENLSRGGLFIQTDRPFRLGDQVGVSLSFPGLLEPIELLGTVAWHRPATEGHPQGVGLQFLRDEDRQKAAAFLEEAARKEGVALEPGGYRILIVEDAPHIQEMFGYAMKRLATRELGGKIPFEVNFAQNGYQALQLLGEQKYDLVMTDLRMPVMDGFALVEKIRADERLRRLPIIAISGMDPEEGQKRAQEVGVDIYLRKPVQFTHVVDTVKQLLRLR